MRWIQRHEKKQKIRGINWTEQGNLCQLLITRKNITVWENCNICKSFETRETKVKMVDNISNRKVYVSDKAIVVQERQKNSLIPIVLTFNATL